MLRSARRLVATSAIALSVLLGCLALAGPASAGKPCRTCKDTSAPSLAFSAPASGATVAGTVTVSGTSSDNVAVSAVAVSVDGSAWQPATGTTSWTWSWSTTALANGSHTVSARATDSSGNATVASRSMTVSNPVPDTAPPTVSISSPIAGSTDSGTVAVQGSAADNISVARVDVAVDGGAWQAAGGSPAAWNWSWSTTALANGTHTITAQATDTSGNTSTTAQTVTVNNTSPDVNPPTVTITSPAANSGVAGSVVVTGSAADDVSVTSVAVAVDGGSWQPASGTGSWSWTWDTTAVADGSHTLAVRAVDSSGNATSASESVTVGNGTVAANPPATQGSWVSPEGLTITVNSAGPWTIAQIYSIVKANALDLNSVGPTLTINVQDQTQSQTQTSATYYGGKYSGVRSTMWLLGVNSNFASTPDTVLTHEYGHAWSNYWYYTAHNGSWGGYLTARWTTSDGSLTLATDSRTNTTYIWAVREIIADDYRLLFGTQAAIAGRPGHLNGQIPDPRNVPGLADYLLNTWR